MSGGCELGHEYINSCRDSGKPRGPPFFVSEFGKTARVVENKATCILRVINTCQVTVEHLRDRLVVGSQD